MTASQRERAMLPIGSLLGLGDETVDVPCRRCKQATTIAKEIFDAIKSWNREEFALVEREANRGRRYEARPIRRDEIVTCETCTPIEREQLGAASREESITASLYLKQVSEWTGDADPHVLAWLRAHGYGRSVDALLANRKATVPRKKPKAGGGDQDQEPADLFDGQGGPR